MQAFGSSLDSVELRKTESQKLEVEQILNLGWCIQKMDKWLFGTMYGQPLDAGEDVLFDAEEKLQEIEGPVMEIKVRGCRSEQTEKLQRKMEDMNVGSSYKSKQSLHNARKEMQSSSSYRRIPGKMPAHDLQVHTNCLELEVLLRNERIRGACLGKLVDQERRRLNELHEATRAVQQLLPLQSSPRSQASSPGFLQDDCGFHTHRLINQNYTSNGHATKKNFKGHGMQESGHFLDINDLAQCLQEEEASHDRRFAHLSNLSYSSEGCKWSSQSEWSHSTGSFGANNRHKACRAALNKALGRIKAGDFAGAKAFLTQSTWLSRREGIIVVEGRACANLAALIALEGDCQEAHRLSQRALHIFRSTGERSLECKTLTNSIFYCIALKRYDEAMGMALRKSMISEDENERNLGKAWIRRLQDFVCSAFDYEHIPQPVDHVRLKHLTRHQSSLADDVVHHRTPCLETVQQDYMLLFPEWHIQYTSPSQQQDTRLLHSEGAVNSFAELSSRSAPRRNQRARSQSDNHLDKLYRSAPGLLPNGTKRNFTEKLIVV